MWTWSQNSKTILELSNLKWSKKHITDVLFFNEGEQLLGVAKSETATSE